MGIRPCSFAGGDEGASGVRGGIPIGGARASGRLSAFAGRPVRGRAAPPPAAPFDSMAAVRDLWALGEDSFRILLEPRLARLRRPASPVDRGSVPAEPLLPPSTAAAERVCPEAIAAPPARVWGALTRLMRGAGIHGLAALESPECRSCLDPHFRVAEPRLGDRVGEVLELVALDPGRALLWRSPGPIELLGHRLDRLWLAYRVCSPRRDWSRVIARARLEAAVSTRAVREHLLDALELALLGPQLEALRRLVEETRAAPPCTCTVHQAAAFVPAPAPIPAPGPEPQASLRGRRREAR